MNPLDAIGPSLSLTGRPDPVGGGKRAHEAARDFEAVFLGQILKGLRRTVPGADEKTPMSQMYQELFDEHLAVELARGGGVGLAKILETYMKDPKPAATPGGTP